MSNNNQNLKEAFEKYQILKRTAYKDTHRLFHGNIPGVNTSRMQITTLNRQCVREIIDTWNPVLNWQAVLKSKNNHKPRNFDVAIYLEDKLCAAAFGRVSKSNSHVRLDYLERNRDLDQLKGYVLNIVVATAVSYASHLRKHQVRITCPDLGLREWFERFADGFQEANCHFPKNYFYLNLD